VVDWISFLAYPNLFGIKDFVVVVTKLGGHRELHTLIAIGSESCLDSETTS
jgi:hypothetical protein